MRLQSLQFVAHIQNVTREIQGQEQLRGRKCKLKFDFVLFPPPPKKVRYFALKNQALCLHPSQRNVN